MQKCGKFFKEGGRFGSPSLNRFVISIQRWSLTQFVMPYQRTCLIFQPRWSIVLLYFRENHSIHRITTQHDFCWKTNAFRSMKSLLVEGKHSTGLDDSYFLHVTSIAQHLKNYVAGSLTLRQEFSRNQHTRGNLMYCFHFLLGSQPDDREILAVICHPAR